MVRNTQIYELIKKLGSHPGFYVTVFEEATEDLNAEQVYAFQVKSEDGITEVELSAQPDKDLKFTVKHNREINYSDYTFYPTNDPNPDSSLLNRLSFLATGYLKDAVEGICKEWVKGKLYLILEDEKSVGTRLDRNIIQALNPSGASVRSYRGLSIKPSVLKLKYEGVELSYVDKGDDFGYLVQSSLGYKEATPLYNLFKSLLKE